MSDKPLLHFEPFGLKIEPKPEETLLEAAQRIEAPIRSDCGGAGVCAKCLVKVDPADSLEPVTEAERAELSPDQLAAGFRLACQTGLTETTTGPITVTLPREAIDSRGALGKTKLAAEFSVDPIINRTRLDQAPLPGDDFALPDLAAWYARRAGRPIELVGPAAWQAAARPEFYQDQVTLVERRDGGVFSILPGDRPRSLGLAVDVGTTTVAGYLCDLASGEMLAAAGTANPQRRFGEDVISRIASANDSNENLDLLARLARRAIDDVAARCLAGVKAEANDIDDLVVVGNSTMEQLLAGLHPHSLGRTPYPPLNRSGYDFNAADLGLGFRPEVNVHLFPVISGFLGGDTTAAILAEQPHRRDEVCLIVDIGTNGELVLGNRTGLWASSCATGPALEGAHISCGVRAAPGAVDRVVYDPDRDALACNLIDQEADDDLTAVGLCGSGLIDSIAALRRAGIIQPNGRFNEADRRVRVEGGIGRAVELLPADRCASGKPLELTLPDVRQVQLAKAALYTGVEMMLERSGLGRIDRTILTGAFGARFDWRNAAAIGLLPRAATAGQVVAVENSAGVGAAAALLDRAKRREAKDIVNLVRVIELSQEAEFNQRFVEAVGFPPL